MCPLYFSLLKPLREYRVGGTFFWYFLLTPMDQAAALLLKHTGLRAG